MILHSGARSWYSHRMSNLPPAYHCNSSRIRIYVRAMSNAKLAIAYGKFTNCLSSIPVRKHLTIRTNARSVDTSLPIARPVVSGLRHLPSTKKKASPLSVATRLTTRYWSLTNPCTAAIGSLTDNSSEFSTKLMSRQISLPYICHSLPSSFRLCIFLCFVEEVDATILG